MAQHEATIVWRRKAGETGQRFSRAHEWRFDGGARVAASASPAVVRAPFSDPAAIDPEEALIASLASCHMLFFVSLAARDGFAVASYEDRATGEMSKRADGRHWMSRVTLHPQILFEGEKRPSAADVARLHHEAHEECYIANSVKTEIAIEGRAEGTLPSP